MRTNQLGHLKHFIPMFYKLYCIVLFHIQSTIQDEYFSQVS